MNKKAISILAVILLAICLISGGCSAPADKRVDIKNWKDLLSLAPEKSKILPAGGPEKEVKPGQNSEIADQELIAVKLYFVGSDGKSLVMEERSIAKTESMARNTLQELIKGPAENENLSAIPEGTRLRDINLKPDGLCIVDLSSQAQQVSSGEQEKLMVYAIANTLGQFPTVKDVTFMIDGQRVDTIAGYLDLSNSIKPD
ncbi:MAG TPA: GerMN domain-containing protein [Gelria sp.]|jgi:germination protein M|nr:GerMN domain-containing protein [Gelria sp.]